MAFNATVRHRLSALFVFNAMAALASGLHGAWGQNTPPSSYILTFDDEFGGTALDLTKWSNSYPGDDRIHRNTPEAEYYAPDADQVQNGILSLTARSTGPVTYTLPDGSTVSKSYTSGMISSYGNFTQTYGWFEIRAKVPEGQGFWPAFWLLPATNGWPPEIDIFEILGNATKTVYMTDHWPNPNVYIEEDGVGSGPVQPGPDYSADFHTFAVDWEPEAITWYIDSVQQFQVTDDIPSEPMYIISNLAVGGPGSWPGPPDTTTPFPGEMDIDYIRVYARDTTVVPLSAVPAPDGATHLLWGDATGGAHLRVLASDGSTASDTALGPYAGWHPLALTVAADNSNHILWRCVDGTVSIWKIDEAGDMASLSYTLYGPYPGWSPVGIAAASDSSDHVLWKCTDNTMSMWRIDSNGSMTYRLFGSYGGWSPIGAAVAADHSDHVLWTYTDNTMSDWRIDPTGAMTYQIDGPYPGWIPVSIGVDSNLTDHILWNYFDGTLSIWNLGSNGALAYYLYGPYTLWSAAMVNLGPDNHENVLWIYPDGTLSVWNISSPGVFTYNIQPPPGN